MNRRQFIHASALLAVAGGSPAAGESAAGLVELHRLGKGGLQPHVALGSDGTLHVAYLDGNPAEADVRIVRRGRTACCLTEPARVNRTDGAALAIGSIRGVRCAVDARQRLHWVWNGSRRAVPQGPGGAPLLYTRSDPGELNAEPERDLKGPSVHLDGGAAVCVGPADRVHVLWHAHWAGGPDGEAGRDLWINTSEDGGRTFQGARRLGIEGGVCACCSLTAASLADGGTLILYRSAEAGVMRDARLIRLDAAGAVQGRMHLSEWRTGQCPMSQASLLPTEDGVLAAWETAGAIQAARVRFTGSSMGLGRTVTLGQKARHPSVARDGDGRILVAWSEGTGWNKGGAVAWQVFDEHFGPTTSIQRQNDLPVWGTVAAAAVPGRKGFELFY